jgi:lipooligosaccharide transport system permease protein
MSVDITNWRGSRVIVNVPRARRWAAWYVAEYRLVSMMKWFWPNFIGGIGSPIIYLFAIGLGIGSMVTNKVEGVSYLAFVAPALLASASINAAMDETSGPVMEGFVWIKNFWSITSTQVSTRQLVNAVWIVAQLRVFVTVWLYLGVLLVFRAIEWAHVWPMFLASQLVGAAFSTVMMAVTAAMKDDTGFFDVVYRFIIAPMFLFSGTFYPLTMLPLYLQWIGWISPLWHATDLARTFAFGLTSPGWLIGLHFGYFAVMTLVGFVISYRLFDKRLSA